VSNYTWTK